MDYQEIIKKAKPELEKTVNYLKGELIKIRTSRPSPSLIEGIEADVFGKKFPIKSLGLISLSEGQDIIVQPWDVSYIPSIEKAISDSPLQASVMAEKDRLRVRFPPLSEDMRKNVARVLSQKAEDTRQTVRHWREVFWKEIKDKFSEGGISEDNKFRAKDQLQELVDEYNAKIEEMVEQKKKDIIA